MQVKRSFARKMFYPNMITTNALTWHNPSLLTLTYFQLSLVSAGGGRDKQPLKMRLRTQANTVPA